MLPTREEIVELLAKAEDNLQRTQEILRDLESLMVHIDWILTEHKDWQRHSAVGKTHIAEQTWHAGPRIAD
jgi:hypothetical protein